MKKTLINQLNASKSFLDKSTESLTEEDSGLTPSDGMMSTAQQIAHIAQTVDWFIEGAFGNGFEMNFEESANWLSSRCHPDANIKSFPLPAGTSIHAGSPLSKWANT